MPKFRPEFLTGPEQFRKQTLKLRELDMLWRHQKHKRDKCRIRQKRLARRVREEAEC